MSTLQGRVVVLGVTGGIACYKSCDLAHRLSKLGATVRVILTKNAAQFVPPLTFETLTHRPVVTDMFDSPRQWEIEHIALAQAADLFVVAPATANLLSKYANGIADDMLTTTLLATTAPVLIAPAMNAAMWRHPATQANLAVLRARGVRFAGPEKGLLACGDIDEGRMSEPSDIVGYAMRLLCPVQDLAGKRVLVTAGPTREAIDPVRYLSNRSSGKMGFALAEAARDRGAEVTLVTGPVSLAMPGGVAVMRVETTAQLFDTVTSLAPVLDIILQAAAPADYTLAAAKDKIKKQAGAALTLNLVETPDIAAHLGRVKRPGQVLVAFAAETEHLIEHARHKLITKNADLIVANDITAPGAGFDVDTNAVTLVMTAGETTLPQMPKRQVADAILDKIGTLGLCPRPHQRD